MAIMVSGSKIKVRTSYFSTYKGTNGICIAIGAPWWKGERYPDLYPSRELLEWWKTTVDHNKEAIEIYKQVYRKQTLSKLDVHKVARELDGKVLLCFEKSTSFCHRHIVAEWLRENGYDCKELQFTVLD